MNKEKSTRRGKIRAYSFLTAAFLVAFGFGIQQHVRVTELETSIQNSYQRSLDELGDYMDNISTALSKQLYAGTATQVSALSAKIWREAGSAKSAMSQLPITELNLENTYRFISQVGDYSMSLSKRAVSGEKLNDDDYANLEQLSNYSKNLNEQINAIRSDLSLGKYQIEKAPDSLQEDEPETEAASTEASFGGGFQEAEDGFTDYPTLIYDGPFSDHIMQITPRMTKEAAAFTREEARQTAADAAKVAVSGVEDGYDEESNLPAYGFKTEYCDIRVTKNGNFLCYMVNHRSIGDQTVSEESAVNLALGYLDSLGIPDMKETYYETANGICTINFSYVQDGVMMYTDLIKVGVAMDTGEIVLFDARGYLVNHTRRELSAPALTQEDAQTRVSAFLTVESSQLVVVPSSGLNELYCYEFKCTSQYGETVLVYVNALTGVEEQILILIENENGTLTV